MEGNAAFEKIIKQAMDALDDQIHILQQAKADLALTLLPRGNATPLDGKSNVPDVHEVVMPQGAPTPGFEKKAGGKTRKEQIYELVKGTGPMLRRDIAKATGISKHTINSVLNEKELFKRDDGGFWSAVEK